MERWRLEWKQTYFPRNKNGTDIQIENHGDKIHHGDGSMVVMNIPSIISLNIQTTYRGMSREGVELVHRLHGRVGNLCDRWILKDNNISLS